MTTHEGEQPTHEDGKPTYTIRRRAGSFGSSLAMLAALGAFSQTAMRSERRYRVVHIPRPQPSVKFNKLSKKDKLRKTRRLTANRSRARNR